MEECARRMRKSSGSDGTLEIMVRCCSPMDGKISTQDRLVNKMPLVAILAIAAVAFAMVYIF